MRFCFAALALFALAFQSACLASSAVPSTLTGDTEALETLFKVLPRLKNLGVEDAESFLSTLCKSDAESLRILKMLDRNVELLLTDIRADYSAIEASSELWSGVSQLMTRALRYLSPEHVSQISSREALNYAIVLMAFDPAKSEHSYDMLGVLSERLVPEQWPEFADWAVYVARPRTFMLPQPLFYSEHLSLDLTASIIQDICSVIVCGNAFEKGSFKRPKREAPEPSSIQSNYVLSPTCLIIWNEKRVQQYREFLETSFRVLKCNTKFTGKLLRTLVPVLHNILPHLHSDSSLKRLAIESLISDSIFDCADEDSASEIVGMAFKADEVILKGLLNTLKVSNKSLVAKHMVSIAKDLKKDITFKKACELLEQLNGKLSTRDKDQFFEDIVEALKLIRQLLSICGNSPEKMVLKKKADNLLANFDAKLPNNQSNSVFYIEIASNRNRIIVARYLLSDSEQRHYHALVLILSLGSFARNTGQLIAECNTPLSQENIVKHMCLLNEAVTDYLPKEELFIAASEARDYICARKKFSSDEFKIVIVFAATVFGISELPGLTLAFSALRLINGGILDGDYLRDHFFPDLEIRSAICTTAIAKWHADRSARSEEDNTAFKAFVGWAISNNHISRSAALVLDSI